jgi:hypothetical protein
MFLIFKYGQLSDGTTNNQLTATLVSNFFNVTHASPGKFHTLFVDNGKVFSMGRNEVLNFY